MALAHTSSSVRIGDKKKIHKAKWDQIKRENTVVLLPL